MKADYIKLSSKGVEATGHYVPHAICSYLLLRAVSLGLWALIFAAGGSAAGLAVQALRVALR
jgi:hypothetical protein